MGLLLLSVLPTGDFLRAHIMHLVALSFPRGNQPAADADSDVVRDLKTWGVLDAQGDVCPAGIASIVMLIEAESPAAVMKSVGSNQAIDSFYREVITVAQTRDALGERENLRRFALLLRDVLQKAEARTPDSKTRRNAVDAAGAHDESVPAQSAERRGANAIEVLAKAVHALAESSLENRDHTLSRGGLRLRRKVLLMPKNSPQQARVVWAIEDHLFPSGETLRNSESYLKFASRRETNPEVSWFEGKDKIDAIFAIYLGTKTCRVSLFSADYRSEVLSLYAELLRQALRLGAPRAWTHEPSHTLVAPSVANPGRRTLTASWVRDINPGVTAAEILGFTAEVWAELSAAMIAIANPTANFADRVRTALAGRSPN